MLHHWLIVVPKNAEADSEVLSRVEAGLSLFLYYKPKRALFHRFSCGVYVLSVSANTETWNMAWPCVLTDNSFIAVAGVPTLESVENDVESGSIPERILRAIREHGPQQIYESIGGTFNIGLLERNSEHYTVSALCDFSGYSSCFFLDAPDFFAVGNRASFVGAFCPRFPEQIEFDTDALSWIFSTTMIMGAQTAFSKVERLRSGSRLRISIGKDPYCVGDLEELPLVPNHFTILPDATIENIDFKSVCERFGKRIRWCQREGIRFRAHLTGGRDTRALAAILANQTALDAVERFSTQGTDRNGDVILATKLADVLNVREKHVISPGTKGSATLSPEEFGNCMLRSPFLYDCQLTAFDGRRMVLSKAANFVTLFGGGGEVYRQEWGSLLPPMEGGAAEMALSLFCRYDPLGLLNKETRNRQSGMILEELRQLNDRNATNLACAFYLEERLSNWGCGHFSNNPNAQFPLLLDFELARTAFSIESVAEHIHFEILRYCGDYLLKIPFLNQRWAGATEVRAQRFGLAPDPFQVDVARNFPWQFDCYRRFRDALIDFCIECGDAFRVCIPIANLERLRTAPLEPFNSAHIKTLFGLCGAIVFSEGAWSRDRDFNDNSDPDFRGNYMHRVIRNGLLNTQPPSNSGVRNELMKCLYSPRTTMFIHGVQATDVSKSDPVATGQSQLPEDATVTPTTRDMAADVATPVSGDESGRIVDANVTSTKVIDKMELREFDFLDFGTSSGGGCIRFAKKRLGGKRGLGIDKNQAAVERMREQGYDCIQGDITALNLPKGFVRFVSISHVLEHLPDLNAVRRAITCAANVASDFLFIQGPWFDADEYLGKRGLKFYWSDWHGHPCHLTTIQLREILQDIGLNDNVFMARVPVVGSNDPAIHPMTSPRDQHDYNVSVHPKKVQNMKFDIDIFREMVCYVRLRTLTNWDQLIQARGGCTPFHSNLQIDL